MSVIQSRRIDRGTRRVNFPTVYATNPTPTETLLTGGNILTLPTSKPASPQFSYTIASGDLPVFNYGLTYGSFYPYLCFSGKNNDASARAVTIGIYRNGSLLQTTSNSATASGQYWTITYVNYGTPAWAVGDVITVFLWSASSTSVTYDYNAYVLRALAIRHPMHDNWMLRKLAYTLTVSPVLTLGTPAVGQGFYYYLSIGSAWGGYYSATAVADLAYQTATNGLWGPGFGTAVSYIATIGGNSATAHPAYGQDRQITAMSYYPVMKLP